MDVGTSVTMHSQNPEDYKKTPSDRFNRNVDVEDIYKAWEGLVPKEMWPKLEIMVRELVKKRVQTSRDLQRETSHAQRLVHQAFKKSQILHVLTSMVEAGEFKDQMTDEELETLRKLLVKKGGKSNSGVLVITVLTSPYPEYGGKVQKFSCQWNCYYCPNEPGQPRSYLHDEPSVLRANRNNFDPVLQFCDRAVTLAMNGHPVDKVELLILGGTWASYPVEYQENFIRDLFYAANTFYSRPGSRERQSLADEKALNEKARCKIIGITLETRPDCINAAELRRFRKYGCTRIQLGVQHTSNEILKKINRGCTNEDTKRALTLLKDSCYKVDIHLMPNLPGASPDVDRQMFNEMLDDPYLQADQWKIYPCETTPWTVIQKWFESGEYVPYDEPTLLEVIMECKARVHPWIRLNRVIRDIPSQYILGGVNNPSMRQVIHIEMAKRGWKCKCIRCREVRDRTPDDVELVVREYQGQGATEYFISFENGDRSIILGFARLRINRLVGRSLEENLASKQEKNVMFQSSDSMYPEEEEEEEAGNDDVVDSRPSSSSRRRARSKSPGVIRRRRVEQRLREQNIAYEELEDDNTSQNEMDGILSPFPELIGAALVRELHVYGQLIPTVDRKAHHAQHVGYGTQLMHEAERIARRHGATKVAVIAGVGVRNFYRRIGYDLEGSGEMMIKHLEPLEAMSLKSKFKTFAVVVALAILMICLAYLIELEE